MLDGLARQDAGIHDGAEIAPAVVAADLRCDPYQFRDSLRRGSRGELAQVCGVRCRHDEHMRRRLRIHVVDGDDVVVAIRKRSGNLAGDDFAENAVRHALPYRLMKNVHECEFLFPAASETIAVMCIAPSG